MMDHEESLIQTPTLPHIPDIRNITLLDIGDPWVKYGHIQYHPMTSGILYLNIDVRQAAHLGVLR